MPLALGLVLCSTSAPSAAAACDRSCRTECDDCPISAIVTAMETRPHDSTTQANGCAAIVRLVPHTKPTTHDLVREQRGIDSVIAAMRYHDDEVRVQAHCLHALGRLASNNQQNQHDIAAAERTNRPWAPTVHPTRIPKRRFAVITARGW